MEFDSDYINITATPSECRYSLGGDDTVHQYKYKFDVKQTPLDRLYQVQSNCYKYFNIWNKAQKLFDQAEELQDRVMTRGMQKRVEQLLDLAWDYQRRAFAIQTEHVDDAEIYFTDFINNNFPELSNRGRVIKVGIKDSFDRRIVNARELYHKSQKLSSK